MADVGFEEFYMNFEELIENADDDIKEVIKQMKLDYSILKKEAHANAKDQKCLLCGADCTSFCNSHSIPQFILKNVSNNFVSGYGVLKNPLSPPSGVKNALVFKNIFNKC